MSAIEDLSERTEKLAEQVEELNGQVARLKRNAAVSILSVVAVVAIAALFVLSGYRQLVTDSRLNSVVGDVLCPVFGLVIGSYDPNTRPAGADRDTYEHTFKTFRDSYEALRCTSPLVPPRQVS